MTVLIVGAGVIGTAIADALTARGVRVTVLDMRSPGRGASQASAGLLTPFIEGRSDGPLLELCTRGLGLWDGFMDRLRDRGGLPVEYARTGTLEVALSSDEATRLQDMRQWLTDLDVESQWMEAAQVPRFEPAVTAAAIGGLLIPSQGFVAVSALGCVPVMSCRGRSLGAHAHQFPAPMATFYARPKYLPALLQAVEAVGIHIVNNHAKLEVYSEDLRKMHGFAEHLRAHMG